MDGDWRGGGRFWRGATGRFVSVRLTRAFSGEEREGTSGVPYWPAGRQAQSHTLE